MSKDIIGGDSFVKKNKKIEPEIKSQTRFFFYALAPDDASASPP